MNTGCKRLLSRVNPLHQARLVVVTAALTVSCGSFTDPGRPPVSAIPSQSHLPSGLQFVRLSPTDAWHGYTVIEAATTEVTQEQWMVVMGYDIMDLCATECDSMPRGPTLPVQVSTFYQALEWLNALSLRGGLQPCYRIAGANVRMPHGLRCSGYRLPTKREWAYAASGGNAAPENPNWRFSQEDHAWFVLNSSNSVHPVGTRRPNSWGLYDTAGNVREWAWDEQQLWAWRGCARTSGRAETFAPALGGAFHSTADEIGLNAIVFQSDWAFPIDTGFRPFRTVE